MIGVHFHAKSHWRALPLSNRSIIMNPFSTIPTDLALLPPSSPIVELRQYQLHPSQSSFYMQRTTQSAPLRKRLPLVFFGFPEMGAIPLNTAVHLYHYPGGHSERLGRRTELARTNEWRDYLGEVKSCMIQQTSEIFVEAKQLNDRHGIKGLQYWIDMEKNSIDSSNTSIVELRKYQLKLGYDTVPKFLEIYSEALPSKLRAAGHPSTELVTLLVSDVGSLNTVYEVWKHGGGIIGQDTTTNFCGLQAMEQSRQASRSAQEWRKGIAQIAELAETFDATILKAMTFSPLR